MSVAAQPIVAPTQPTHIVSAGGRRLPIYPFDWLWLARAVQPEGAPHELVAQTLVNRWAWFIDQGARTQFPTLTALVRAYAQPVNPRWMPGGALHEAVLRNTAAPEMRAQLIERARRRRDVHATRSRFDAATQAAVAQALLQGPITIPAGAVHYSAGNSKLPVLVPPSGPHQNTIYGAFLPSTLRALYRLEPARTPAGKVSLRPIAATLAALGLLAAGARPARH